MQPVHNPDAYFRLLAWYCRPRDQTWLISDNKVNFSPVHAAARRRRRRNLAGAPSPTAVTGAHAAADGVHCADTTSHAIVLWVQTLGPMEREERRRRGCLVLTTAINSSNNQHPQQRMQVLRANLQGQFITRTFLLQ